MKNKKISENICARKTFSMKFFMILQFPPLCTKRCKYKCQINDFLVQNQEIAYFRLNLTFPPKSRFCQKLIFYMENDLFAQNRILSEIHLKKTKETTVLISKSAKGTGFQLFSQNQCFYVKTALFAKELIFN